MNVKEKINHFLKKFGYFDDDNIEGILFYGSYQTKTNTKYSDVDLIIIYSSESKKESIKKYQNFEDLDFEIYERTLQNLYERVDFDFNHYEDTLVSAVGYSEILLDQFGNIKLLQQYVLEKYKDGLPKLEESDCFYYLKSIHKSMEVLKQMEEEQCPYFSIFYSITLDKIRQYYNQKNGFSNMSCSKVYKLYTNQKMQEVQHKNMPETKFIELYLQCIHSIQYDNIQKIFQYVMGNKEEIDFWNLTLKIGNRNH